jgi:hypothetical protein
MILQDVKDCAGILLRVFEREEPGSMGEIAP